MVLTVCGKALKWADCEGPEELFDAYPNLLEGAKELAAEKPVHVRPEGVLYARQKEFVVGHRGEHFSDGSPLLHLGTDDVLTCHVLVLHHPFTQTFALAHFDEYVRDPGLKRFLNAFLTRVRQRYYCDDSDTGSFSDGEDEDCDYEYVDEENEENEEDDFDIDGPVLLHIVGGYADAAGKAAKLSKRLLRFFHGLGQASPGEENNLADLSSLRNDQVFELRTCCVGLPNSRPGQYFKCLAPVISGVALDVRTGDVSPARFNRTLLDEEENGGKMDEETMNLLMLGPLLKPRPERLKKMIKQLEDRGYNGSQECRSIA